MSFSEFVGIALGIVERADPEKVKVKAFVNDRESGRFSVRFSDGTEITAHPSSTMATVRFGSGHQAMVNLREIEGIA